MNGLCDTFRRIGLAVLSSLEERELSGNGVGHQARVALTTVMAGVLRMRTSIVHLKCCADWESLSRRQKLCYHEVAL
jgi:hypothetical protein